MIRNKKRYYRYKPKEYQVTPQVEGQGLLFGLSDIEKKLLARKKKPLSEQDRQAIRELQGAGLIDTRGGNDKR